MILLFDVLFVMTYVKHKCLQCLRIFAADVLCLAIDSRDILPMDVFSIIISKVFRNIYD